MAYDPEHYLPGEHELARIVNHAPDPAWRRKFHKAADRRCRLHLVGHNTMLNNYRRAVRKGIIGEEALELIDLGGELHGIFMLPEFTGLDPQDVPTYQDPVGLQVAINTANILGLYAPSDLPGFADDAAMELDKEDPIMANLVTMVTRIMYHDGLSPRMVQKVKAGAAIMRIMDISAWHEHGNRAA